jgi:hypothetical protein
LPQSEPHDEFLELCASSISGDLSVDEQKRLREHLAACLSCREALRQYGAIARGVIPTIAASDASETSDKEATPGWSQEKAERALFDRRASEEKNSHNQSSRPNGSSFFPHRILPFSSDSTWRNVWVLYAAGILLFCALSFFAYRVGVHRGTEVVTAPPQPTRDDSTAAQTSLEEQLSDAGHDRAVAKAEIAQRDKVIAELRRLLVNQSTEISELKRAQSQLASDLHAENANKEDLSQQKTDLAKKLESAENNSQVLQQKLDSLSQKSTEDAARANASQSKVDDLTRQLQEQQAAVKQRDEMLAKDRDIRDLMGARDLYIAEIYDVAGTGETKKPYGRVFYTRGKSLIFYAYDLDQQAGLKQASTFQAWGRRGPDRQKALNLGVFYEDNAARRRWILKCDDPKTLVQIDAIFVTVEPQGGSHKPGNKTLLFASLKIDPNHP